MPNEKIILAGGCFWCTQSLFIDVCSLKSSKSQRTNVEILTTINDFDKEKVSKNVPGVVSAVSGYSGGRTENPTYEDVCSGQTGHIEVVEVTYDPPNVETHCNASLQPDEKVLEKILEIFWRDIDPTDPGGQFADRGTQYQTAIFYSTEEQKRIVEESKKKLQDSGRFEGPIVTKILKAAKFYPAEEYHQNYSQKAPEHYQSYRIGSGREEFVREKWNVKGECGDGIDG